MSSATKSNVGQVTPTGMVQVMAAVTAMKWPMEWVDDDSSYSDLKQAHSPGDISSDSDSETRDVSPNASNQV